MSKQKKIIQIGIDHLAVLRQLDVRVSPHTDLELLAAIEGDKTTEQEMEELMETLDRQQQLNKKDKKHGRHDGLK